MITAMPAVKPTVTDGDELDEHAEAQQADGYRLKAMRSVASGPSMPCA
jgi:hypothetical protein